MTTERRVSLPIQTSADGAKCGVMCPWLGGLMDDHCTLWNLRTPNQRRHEVCLNHEGKS